MTPPANDKKTYDCIVVGGGQAGLASGYYLKKAGLSFLILEKATEIGTSWRNRYDSLVLFTPNRYCQLPGAEFPGTRDEHSTKNEIAAYIKKYAEDQNFPIVLGQNVLEVTFQKGMYKITTEKEEYMARSVIIATGPFQIPFIPNFPEIDGEKTLQIHSANYKNPSQVRGPKVLVVGGGNSGAQIAEELATFTNKKFEVYFSVKGHLSFISQKVLGKNIFWWMEKFCLLYAPKSSLRARLLNRSEPVIGTDLKRLIKNGQVTVLPEFTGKAEMQFDTIIWATGYRQNYDFIKIQNVLNENGALKHDGGIISNQPGLYCIGQIWQKTRGSALVGGVGRDAEKIVDHLRNFLSKSHS